MLAKYGRESRMHTIKLNPIRNHNNLKVAYLWVSTHYYKKSPSHINDYDGQEHRVPFHNFMDHPIPLCNGELIVLKAQCSTNWAIHPKKDVVVNKDWCGKEKSAAPLLLIILKGRGSVWGSYCRASEENIRMHFSTPARKRPS